MKKNTNNKLQTCLLIVLTAGVIGSSTVSVISLNRVSKLNATIEAQKKVTKENDVIIADIYSIKDTKNISDAYKSGDESKLTENEKETLKLAKGVLSEIIKDGMSDYEKEKAVYDWMTKNISSDTGQMTVIPTTSEGVDNPYGVLKNHKGVCVGFATTFRLFMDMMDIPCKVVHNNSEYHSWNLVELDGEWYHTDTFSDATNGNYSHFNIGDAKMAANDETWDVNFFPAATGLKYNEVYQAREEVSDIYKVPARVRKALEDNESVLGFSFKEDISEQEQQLLNTTIDTMGSLLMGSEVYNNKYLADDWMIVDGKPVLGVYITTEEKNSNDVNDDVDSEETRKMMETIQKAFKGSGVNTDDIAFMYEDLNESDNKSAK